MIPPSLFHNLKSELGRGVVLNSRERLSMANADINVLEERQASAAGSRERGRIDNDIDAAPHTDDDIVEVTEDHRRANTRRSALREIARNEIRRDNIIAEQLVRIVEDEVAFNTRRLTSR